MPVPVWEESGDDVRLSNRTVVVLLLLVASGNVGAVGPRSLAWGQDLVVVEAHTSDFGICPRNTAFVVALQDWRMARL